MENKAQTLINFVKNNLSLVSKLTKQLSENEAEKLIEKFGFEEVKTMLIKMNNWKPLTKNVSVYQTTLKWFSYDEKKADPPKAVAEYTKELDFEKRRALFDAKHKVGSTFQYNGDTYKVTATGVLSWGVNNFTTVANFLRSSLYLS